MSDALLDPTRPVRPGEELPLDALAAWLRAVLPGSSGPLTVEQFPGGYSNLTYLLRLGDLELVLRRPPVGAHVKTGHDMGREVRVLSRLSTAYPLAPRPLAFCEDPALLGAPFYVMERRKGLILRKEPPPGLALDPARLAESLVRGLAELHAIDVVKAGLADFGKPAGYVERQVTGWTQRYRDARTDDWPELEAVAAWLAANRPAESGAALIHNDYKYDNLVLDAADPTRIVAVLDWEMATLGDPLMDLGTTLGYWVEAGDDPAWQAMRVGPTAMPGSPTRRQLAEKYGEITGRDVSGILFHYAFGLLKIAVIAQQIYARYARGQTRDPRFSRLNQVVGLLGRTGAHALEAQRI